jgi:PAS domain S-box-containing protein
MMKKDLDKNYSEDMFKEAEEARVNATEQKYTHIRSGIILFNLLTYYFILDKTHCIPALANAVTIMACLYTLYMEIVKPYRKYPIFLASYFRAITDCTLISLWLMATGGYYSPYFVLWYISLFGVAFRFSVLATILSSIAYAACYILLIYLSDSSCVTRYFPEISIRVGYILFSGVLGKLITEQNFHKIQQRKNLEKLTLEIKETNDKLMYQTTLYENMLKTQSELGEGVAIVKGYKIIYVNDAFCNIVGSAREELLSNEKNMHLLGSEEKQEEGQRTNERLNGKSADRYNETVIKGKNGEKKSIGYSSRVFEMNGGKNLVFIIRDITEQKSKDVQLKKKTLDLVLQNEELEQFVYIASHDLQEPLRMITSFLTQLEKKYKGLLDEKAQQYIYFATDGAERMRKIILDLLEYSRVGRKEYVFEKIDMNMLVHDMTRLYRNKIAESDVDIVWKNLPEVNGGKTLLHEVIQNLVGNAIKYKKVGVKTRVEITSSETPSHWQFSVADNGIGIDPIFHDKIFILFQRLHNRNEYSGTGIGLAICKKIIENHKGKIWVDSCPGEGSTFHFTIIK